jgi:hypothetical protein
MQREAFRSKGSPRPVPRRGTRRSLALEPQVRESFFDGRRC